MARLKSSQGFSAVEALLVLVVVSILGFTGWFVYHRAQKVANKSNNSQSSSQATTSPKQQYMPQDVINKIKATLKGQYTVFDTASNNHPASGQVSIHVDDTTPPYRVAGFKFYVRNHSGASIEIMTHEDAGLTGNLPHPEDQAMRTTVAKIYTNDFKLTKTTSEATSLGDSPDTDVYEGGGLICTIDMTTEPSALSTASCGRIQGYTETAKTYKPFIDVLPSATDLATGYSGLKLTTGQNGFTRASMHVPDAEAEFYKSPTGSWTYFGVTQQGFDCSKFNTSDLKNAFSGFQCYASSGQTSTVQ